LPSPLPNQWGVEPCLDLINSRWSDHLGSGAYHDRLPSPVWRRAFVKRWKLKAGDLDDPRARARLARLRGVLHDALEHYIEHGRLGRSLRHSLEAEINRSPLVLRIASQDGREGLSLERSGKAWDVLTAEVATSAMRLIGEGRLVKVCANPSCSWMFVDESKPGSRRWCDVSICGSLINVRRHRGSAKDQPHQNRGVERVSGRGRGQG